MKHMIGSMAKVYSASVRKVRACCIKLRMKKRKSGRERGCAKLIDSEICLAKECQSISSLRMDDGANE